MTKYNVTVTFNVVVEAEDEEDAENQCWNWYPRHPQDDGDFQSGETVSPSTVHVEA